jgi:hypothetical protein
MKRMIIASILIFCASRSIAAGLSGTELYGFCTNQNKSVRTVCETWISGFQAGIYAQSQAAKTDVSVCLPDGFTGAQAKLIIDKFMKDFPATLHNQAEIVAFFALSREFPCKGSKSN